MYMLRVVPLMIAALLFLTACGAPAPGVAPVGESAAEETTAGDAAMDGSAQSDEMEPDASADDSMPAEEVPAEEAAMDSEPETMESDSDEGMETEDSAAENMTDAADVTDRPAWQQISLTDARTGEGFALADFAGKTVFVEPFATWCSNCRRQLGNVAEARAQLGDEAVFIALSVEPNIGNDVLARYAENEGFDLIFAAMPPEMLQELAARFGQTVSNPPATPHFIIRSDGSVTDLVTGIESADEIVSQIQAEQG